MEYDKDIRATELIKRFRSLVKHAEIVAFPKAKNSIFLPANMETWHSVRKFLYKAATPYLYTNEKDKSWALYFSLSFFLFIMVIYTLALAQQIANNHAVEFSKFLFGVLVVLLLLKSLWIYWFSSRLSLPYYPTDHTVHYTWNNMLRS